MESKGTVFNIQRYSVHDGPGIRTVVFLKGCPLRCRWCGNPESQSTKKQVAWSKGSCIGCKCCINALEGLGCHFKNDVLYWDKNASFDDTLISKTCPSKALHVIGEEKTVSEVMDVVIRDEIFYKICIRYFKKSKRRRNALWDGNLRFCKMGGIKRSCRIFRLFIYRLKMFR